MPAEWAKHESTWLSWPKNPLTFPSKILSRVEEAYVLMVEALTRGERVDILVDGPDEEDRVSSLLPRKNVAFHRIRSADVWMRDYGPIFIRNEEKVAATKWRFNAWGDKYDDLVPDDATGLAVARSTGMDIFQGGMVLEGGSIDVNGKGALLTTEQCLLNKNRNPGLTKAEIEVKLRDYLGAEEVVWLERGIEGDDTDGHIDDVARFVSEDTAVCMVEGDRHDRNHSTLKRDFEILKGHRMRDGGRLEVVPIEMPRRLKGDEGWLPASYANFYIGNAALLLPVFGDPKNDEKAVKAMESFFPGKDVVQVRSNELVYGFGGIHCVTQQQPA